MKEVPLEAYSNVFCAWSVGFVSAPQDSQERMMTLLAFHFFTQADVELNAEVLQWPKDILPVFDENEKVSLQIFM